ncbi:Uncharacterised protein [Mycobacterium tuberculosis]|uniref:Uncharacterized protein n=1 Tax=Mycobacterium tuberculosis TaxID=1773 RepID=A0A655FXL8_MYCTX|nr:Uncharacterised protein [Mycobacterium tuberculosis]CNW31655.1 Uncharacterised protein [Mycobacterium tuberculosis]
MISLNRLTANSIAGIRSLMLKGFTRYAIAPASRARSTRSRWLNAVSTTIGAIRLLAISDAASIPSRRGIFTSMITRSGLCSSASSTASWPSPASPTISYPSSRNISARSMRMSASSSAIKTRRGTAASASVVGPVMTDIVS